MEIALDPSVPTYSGGLGVLAGAHVASRSRSGNVDGWSQPCPSERLLSPDPDSEGNQEKSLPPGTRANAGADEAPGFGVH
jgi:hypothetical protein